MKIEIDDEQFDMLLASKLKQDYIDCVRIVAYHKEHGIDNEDSDFHIELMRSYPQILRYYMAPHDADMFIIDVARGEYAD
jgi:hypothetical protein